jgi:hypothetical protein
MMASKSTRIQRESVALARAVLRVDAEGKIKMRRKKKSH